MERSTSKSAASRAFVGAYRRAAPCAHGAPLGRCAAGGDDARRDRAQGPHDRRRARHYHRGLKLRIGLWEGSTENATVATALLADLLDRDRGRHNRKRCRQPSKQIRSRQGSTEGMRPWWERLVRRGRASGFSFVAQAVTRPALPLRPAAGLKEKCVRRPNGPARWLRLRERSSLGSSAPHCPCSPERKWWELGSGESRVPGCEAFQAGVRLATRFGLSRTHRSLRRCVSKSQAASRR